MSNIAQKILERENKYAQLPETVRIDKGDMRNKLHQAKVIAIGEVIQDKTGFEIDTANMWEDISQTFTRSPLYQERGVYTCVFCGKQGGGRAIHYLLPLDFRGDENEKALCSKCSEKFDTALCEHLENKLSNFFDDEFADRQLERVITEALDEHYQSGIDMGYEMAFHEGLPPYKEEPTFAMIQEMPLTYYIYCDGYLKIGFSNNVSSRFASLKRVNDATIRPNNIDMSNAQILRLDKGGAYREGKLHKKFSYLNAIGEWFYFDEDLRTHVMTGDAEKIYWKQNSCPDANRMYREYLWGQDPNLIGVAA